MIGGKSVAQPLGCPVSKPLGFVPTTAQDLKVLEQDSLKAVLPLPIKMIRRHFI